MVLAELFRARSGAPWVRKFGYLCIREILVTRNRPACPSAPQAYQCKITINRCGNPNGTRGFWREIAGPRGRFGKKKQLSRVFLRLSFNVYTDMDNRERARARDRKQRRRIFLEKST